MANEKHTGFMKRVRYAVLRSWIFYAPISVAVWLLGHLPLSLARSIGRFGGWVGYVLDVRNRAISKANLQLAFPEKSPVERRAILRASYIHLGLCLAEFCRFTRLTAEDVREHWVVDEDGSFDRLRQALASGKGAILNAGHLGAWELSALAFPAHGLILNTVARRVEAERIDTLIMRTRQHLGTVLHYQENGLFHMYRALRKGKLVGLHVDQYAGRKGLYVPFFGRDASSVDTCARLHVMTGAPIFCGAIQRRTDGRYVCRVRPVEIPPAREGQNEDERIREVLCLCHRGIEDLIRLAPEQWLWFHPRWRDHRRSYSRTRHAVHS
jgi:KDO2-lipid IV(A) lauroyltransferase